MHASLRLDNLSKLPDNLKATAISASNGSLDDLEKVHRLIRVSPTAHLRIFIPAFLENLKLDELRTPRNADLPDCLARAIRGLKGVSILSMLLVSEAYVEAWSVVWSWIQFYLQCEQQQPGLTETYRVPMYTQILAAVLSLRRDMDTRQKIAATPRIRFVLTRAWATAIEGGQIPDTVIVDLCLFLSTEISLVNPTVGEAIEGAGGTLDHLTSLIVQHIRYFVPRRDHIMSESDGFGALGIFRVLHEVGVVDISGPLSASLLKHGLVTAICAVACAVCASPELTATTHVIKLVFPVIAGCLTKVPEFRWIKEAFDGGLLRAIVLAATRDMASLVTPIHYILHEVIPASLAYHSVLSSMAAALTEARAPSTPKFIASMHFREWDRVFVLGNERLKVMTMYDCGLLADRRACDNLECTEIRPDDALSRCAACQNAFYCSKPCQAADWTAGHRTLCANPQNKHPKEVEPLLSTADRAFQRVLLHHDYEEMRAEVLTEQLHFMRLRPGEQCFVKFDYSAGRAVISVGPPGPGARGAFGARVAKSAGRVEMHIVVMSEGIAVEGAHMRSTGFPMRSDSAVVHDALVGRAASGQEITPAMVEELMALEVVRTH